MDASLLEFCGLIALVIYGCYLVAALRVSFCVGNITPFIGMIAFPISLVFGAFDHENLLQEWQYRMQQARDWQRRNRGGDDDVTG